MRARLGRVTFSLIFVLAAVFGTFHLATGIAQPEPQCLDFIYEDVDSSIHFSQADVRSGQMRDLSQSKPGQKPNPIPTFAFLKMQYTAYEEDNPVSADGQRVAYTWADPQGIGLGIVEKTGTHPRTTIIPLSHIPPDMDWADVVGWSADGQYIALRFRTSTPITVIYELVSVQDLRLLPDQLVSTVEHGGMLMKPLVWSPSGHHYAYMHDDGQTPLQLVVGSPTESAKRTFTPTGQDFYRNPRIIWSTDSQYAAFYSDPDAGAAANVLGIDGTAHTVTPVNADFSWWLGHVFFYTGRLEDAGNQANPRVDLLAFYPDQNRSTTILRDIDSAHVLPSPDRQRLAVAQSQNSGMDVEILDENARTLAKLVQNADSVTQLLWSSAQNLAVIWKGKDGVSRLTWMNTLQTGTLANISSAQWLQDGSLLFYAGEHDHIAAAGIVDTLTNRSYVIVDGLTPGSSPNVAGISMLGQVIESPTGNRLATFLGFDETNDPTTAKVNLYFTVVDTHQTKLVRTGIHKSYALWSPGGTMLAMFDSEPAQPTSSIEVIGIDGSAIKAIPFSFMTYSPNPFSWDVCQ